MKKIQAISVPPIKGCLNLEDSQGFACTYCNRCGRWDKKEKEDLNMETIIWLVTSEDKDGCLQIWGAFSDYLKAEKKLKDVKGDHISITSMVVE
mgnify:CR=1 FL=1